MMPGLTIKALNELKKRALHDMWAFAELIKFKGGQDNFDDFHIDMSSHYCKALDQGLLKELKKNPDLWLNHPSTFVNIVARGYLKSTVNTILYSLWRVYRNPNLRFSINTNTQPLAYSFIRELRSYLEDVDLIDSVWDARPHIPGKLIPNLKTTKLARGASVADTEATDNKIIWNNVALQVIRNQKLKEPTFAIGSANSINTGNHYDVVIFDDVVDFTNSSTLDKRIKLQRWVNEVESQLDPLQVVPVDGSLIPLLDVIGYKVINGTLYYDEDLYSKFIERQQLGNRVSIHLRNIYVNGENDSDGFEWASKFNKAVIQEIKERIDDPVVFAAQYENKTLQKFRTESSEARNLVLTNSKPIVDYDTVTIEHEGIHYTTKLFAAMDVASSHDFSVLTIGAYLTDDVFAVVDVLTNRGSLEAFLKDAYHMVQEQYPVQVCFVEANGIGGGCKTALGLIHQLNNKGSFVPLKFTEIYQTESKQMRLAYCMRYLMDNKVIVSGNVSHNSTYIKQLKAYPSEYDDVPDCLATCLYRFPKVAQIYDGNGAALHMTQFQIDDLKATNAKLRLLYRAAKTAQHRQTNINNVVNHRETFKATR